MPRSVREIIDQADKLAARFEDHEPDPDDIHDAGPLRDVRRAFRARAQAERDLAEAVSVARAKGHSWATIGAMVGTSGEAAVSATDQPSPPPPTSRAPRARRGRRFCRRWPSH